MQAPAELEIDDDEIRQDINNDDIKRLYNLIKNERGNYDSLNDEMDKHDKDTFLNTLRSEYYPDGFFITSRVANKGFTDEEIDEIAMLSRPFSGEFSRKKKPT